MASGPIRRADYTDLTRREKCGAPMIQRMGLFSRAVPCGGQRRRTAFIRRGFVITAEGA